MRGEVVYKAPPYWLVVRRLDGRGYDVVDTSVEPARRVHGPADKDDATAFARSHSLTYLTLKGVYL